MPKSSAERLPPGGKPGSCCALARVTGMAAAAKQASDAIAARRDWGLVDTLRERYPDPGIYSYWDYRAGDFHQRRGMRIDYLLSSRALAERSRADLIDRNARKGSKPSDHAPVLGLFEL